MQTHGSVIHTMQAVWVVFHRFIGTWNNSSHQFRNLPFFFVFFYTELFTVWMDSCVCGQHGELWQKTFTERTSSGVEILFASLMTLDGKFQKRLVACAHIMNCTKCLCFINVGWKAEVKSKRGHILYFITHTGLENHSWLWKKNTIMDKNGLLKSSHCRLIVCGVNKQTLHIRATVASLSRTINVIWREQLKRGKGKGVCIILYLLSVWSVTHGVSIRVDQ